MLNNFNMDLMLNIVATVGIDESVKQVLGLLEIESKRKLSRLSSMVSEGWGRPPSQMRSFHKLEVSVRPPSHSHKLEDVVSQRYRF
jgi:hypothetical protein